MEFDNDYETLIAESGFSRTWNHFIDAVETHVNDRIPYTDENREDLAELFYGALADREIGPMERNAFREELSYVMYEDYAMLAGMREGMVNDLIDWEAWRENYKGSD